MKFETNFLLVKNMRTSQKTKCKEKFSFLHIPGSKKLFAQENCTKILILLTKMYFYKFIKLIISCF